MQTCKRLRLGRELACSVPCRPHKAAGRPWALPGRSWLHPPASYAQQAVSVETDVQEPAAGVSRPSTLQPLPEPKDGQVWYFAFGSNMNSTVLSGRRAVQCLTSLPCKLPGYTLGFHMYGLPYVEPGMGTIERVTPSMKTAAAAMAAPSGTAPVTAQQAYAARVAAGLHGVVHLISAEGWEQVKRTEGVRLKGIGYQVVEVCCELYDGRQVPAVTLQAAPVSTGDIKQFLPSNRYLNLLREGAKEAGVDPAYCDMLDNHPAYQPLEGVRATVGKSAMTTVLGGVLLGMTPFILMSMLHRRVFPPSDNEAPPPTPPPPPPPKRDPPTTPPSASATDATSSNGSGGRPDASGAPASSQQQGQQQGQQQQQPRPSPVFRVMQALRGKVHPNLMTFAFLISSKIVWLVHDVLLALVLGSGKNNDRRVPVPAAASNN